MVQCFSLVHICRCGSNGMVWYGMVTLFIHGISFRYIYIHYRITNFLTNLKSKIKTKIIKMKREHLLFKETMCKNRTSLIKLFVNRNLSLNYWAACAAQS